jgi:SAM-dependent methyltransferase
VSLRQLQHGLRIDEATGIRVPTVCASGTHLPFSSGSLDVVFSAFGAMQFVSEADTAVAEIARVLVPGGRFAFSITHPIRWAMPDDPGEEGLAVTNNYFDRTPYVEVDEDEQVRYVEHHRTLGDWVRVLARHGFALADLIEPEWPEGHERIWGGWGPVRGRLIPGTALYVADKRLGHSTGWEPLVPSPHRCCSFRSGQTPAQEHHATRSSQKREAAERAEQVPPGLTGLPCDLVGVRRQADGTLGGTDDHGLGLGALGALLERGVQLTVLLSRCVALLDDLRRALVREAAGTVHKLGRTARGGPQAVRQEPRTVGCVAETVSELTRTIGELL